MEAEDPSLVSRKRKLFRREHAAATGAGAASSSQQQQQQQLVKKQKTSPYVVPQLPHILALLEERLPFVYLTREVSETTREFIKTNCCDVKTDLWNSALLCFIDCYHSPANGLPTAVFSLTAAATQHLLHGRERR